MLHMPIRHKVVKGVLLLTTGTVDEKLWATAAICGNRRISIIHTPLAAAPWIKRKVKKRLAFIPVPFSRLSI